MAIPLEPKPTCTRTENGKLVTVPFLVTDDSDVQRRMRLTAFFPTDSDDIEVELGEVTQEGTVTEGLLAEPFRFIIAVRHSGSVRSNAIVDGLSQPLYSIPESVHKLINNKSVFSQIKKGVSSVAQEANVGVRQGATLLNGAQNRFALPNTDPVADDQITAEQSFILRTNLQSLQITNPIPEATPRGIAPQSGFIL